MTRWLDADEQRAWRAFLSATQVLNAQLDRELQRDSGIPHTYYEILVRLSEAPDRALRMSELAQAAESSRSRLSHAVARLEEAGWVQRESCPTDRRGAFARLTDAGFTALEAAAPAHVESVRRHLFDRLTPAQVTQLREIGEAILAGLRDEEPARGGPPARPVTVPSAGSATRSATGSAADEPATVPEGAPGARTPDGCPEAG